MRTAPRRLPSEKWPFRKPASLFFASSPFFDCYFFLFGYLHSEFTFRNVWRSFYWSQWSPFYIKRRSSFCPRSAKEEIKGNEFGFPTWETVREFKNSVASLNWHWMHLMATVLKQPCSQSVLLAGWNFQVGTSNLEVALLELLEVNFIQ